MSIRILVMPVYYFVMLVVYQYALENEELTQHLGAAKDAQRALTSEVTHTHKTLSLFTYTKLFLLNGFIQQ